MGGLKPVGGGLLELRVPWATLAGKSADPGHLSRLGPISPSQARYLADLATRDPAADWRIIVTGLDGRAVAVARARVQSGAVQSWAVQSGAVQSGIVQSRAAQSRAAQSTAAQSTAAQSTATQSTAAHQINSQSGQAQSGLIRRVTVIVSRDDLAEDLSARLAVRPVDTGWHWLLAAALRVAEHADKRAAADSAAGGCAHANATLAYRPSARLRELVTARDVTCRFPTCRQPMTRCDLDHTKAFSDGGVTCDCNLGGLCRFHHQLKQHPRWRLTQPIPGSFIWTTPAGQSYSAVPDCQRE